MMITACLIITASATHQSNTAAYSHREHKPDEIKGKLEASLSQCRQQKAAAASLLLLLSPTFILSLSQLRRSSGHLLRPWRLVV